MDVVGATVDLASHSPVHIATPGMVLREWDERDVQAMVELFDDPEIAMRTPLPSPFTVADARERVARAQRTDRLLLAITADGNQPLGEVLLTATGELGYMVGAPHRRQGLAAQALLLLRDHAHDALGLAVLRLKIEADNPASAAVAARAGFRLTGVAVEAVENKGRRHTIDLWEHATGQPDASG